MAEEYNQHQGPHHSHHEVAEEERSNDQYGQPTTVVGVDEVAVAPVETKDRGLFDFMGKKEEEKDKKPQDDEEVIVTEFEKVKVSEPEPEPETKEECKEEGGEKKDGLFRKLQKSSSSSSSVSTSSYISLAFYDYILYVLHVYGLYYMK